MARPHHRAAGLVQEQGSSATSPDLGAATAAVSARLSPQPLPIPDPSSSSRTARHCGSLSHDACGRARPCHRMGSVLAVLARGSLFYEEGPRAVVPRAGYQGGARCRRGSLAPLGCLSGARPQHGPVARWPRARPVLSRVGVRDLGARAHRAQLGHPDDAEGRAGAGDQRPLPPGPPPDLLGRPRRQRRPRGGAELAVADRPGPGRCLLRLQRDRREALPDRAVPDTYPVYKRLDQDARAGSGCSREAAAPPWNASRRCGPPSPGLIRC